MSDVPPPDVPVAPPTWEDVQRLVNDGLAQLASQVPEIAKRTLDQPTVRLGVVQSWDRDTNIAQVIVDGDDGETPINNWTGLELLADQRVALDFYPPDGVAVTGVLGLAGQSPVGALLLMETHDAPTGYLGPCDGTAFDADAYPDLAEYLGAATLPDYSGRFPVFVDADHALGVQGGSRFLQQHQHHLDDVPGSGHVGPGVFTQENPSHYNEPRGDSPNPIPVTEGPHVHELDFDIGVDVTGDTDLNTEDTIIQEPEWVALNVFIKF